MVKTDKNIKYYFILPVVAFILCVGIFPLLFSIYMSFSKWIPASGGIQFIGTQNFRDMFRDPRFIHAFWLSFIYVFSTIVLQLALGILLAMLLQKDLVGKNFFRVSYMLPMLLSPVAISYAWKMILDFNRGPMNYFLTWFGISPIEWLGKGNTAVISLVMVDVWQWTPVKIQYHFPGIGNSHRGKEHGKHV